ncbi:hypothetical protein RN001_014946 [Aquatica leii]|uniref:Peptidase S1 domain-containing protein n=1 Tax=Aquatica leii TaxID=1421715 RepID=A0AAN7PQ07_9COLE|nr:hypothetical protein RN001_014946 [Aquatica leii]
MSSFILFGLLLTGAWAGPVASPFGKIVGGSPAGVGQYPHQVSLRIGTHFCGGSIISANWVLTAAHCLYGMDIPRITVVVGTNQLNAGGTSYALANAIIHENYNPAGTANDIGLIQVRTNIVTSNLVKIISLASTQPPDFSECRLSGWGLTSFPSEIIPNNLQHIQLYKISLAECRRGLPNFAVYDSNVCTFKGAGQGACKGDSGGPLISGNVQIGVVSWGIPCALGVPDVFTSVPSYRAWIRSYTGI